MDGYEELANTIILQAVKDYRAAHQRLKRYPDSAKAKRLAAEVEAFFRSTWYTQLTDVPPLYLIDRLKKEENE